MKRVIVLSVLALAAQPGLSQDKVNIGISGWTGFAPLTLALQAGIFKKNGVEATIKKIPQQSRHLAIASGDIQCAATTVETWLVWNANGVLTKQIFQLDKSFGADGMATRANIAKIADLKGKTIGSQAPGTSPYFVMAWMLKKNGLTPKDVTVVSIDPATGKTLWTFKEPLTPRHEYSMRSNHGKGVTYARINGRGVIFVTTPGFFLHALDPKTGQPIANWGGAVPIDGFPKSGSVDLLKDLIADWTPWRQTEQKYDPASAS